MEHNTKWTLSLGRWVNVPVRVHVLFLLFLAFLFSVDGPLAFPAILSTAMVTAAVLIVSVIVHELAHVFAIHNLGGEVRRITFMPWGGDSDLVLPEQKSAQLIAILAGPFVNFVLFLFGAILLVQSTSISLFDILHPFKPHGFHSNDVASSLIKIGTWVNFQLLVANLIPCFPFDGAAAMRVSLKWFDDTIPEYRLESAIRVTGTAVSLACIGFAWLLRDFQTGPVEPVWFVFLAIGICLYFAARYSFEVETEDLNRHWDSAEGSLELSDLYAADAHSFSIFGEGEDPEYSRWLRDKQEARVQFELEREQLEADQADGVLEKLHQSGIESLSTEERLLLQRVSDRLRRKRKLDVIE